MTNNSEIKYFEGFNSPNQMKLQSGQELGPITIAYETFGKLNDSKDNAVLVCHALTGDAHVSGENGWWDFLIGPNKAIDTNKNFVICSNAIGGCKGSTGPSSKDPKTGKPYGLNFPVITIGDMVQAQKALIDELGIAQLKMVLGGSMGGMQAMEWSIMYPKRVKACTVVASASKLSPQALAFDAVSRNAITSDEKWAAGNYAHDEPPEKGLAIARMIGHITYLSNESMNKKFGRKLQKKEDYSYDFSTDFQIESYLKYQGDKFVNRFDANSYLYISKAVDYFDLTKKYGSVEKAFKNTNCKFLVIAISTDWLFSPKQSKDIVKALLKQSKEVTYAQIDSPFGHDAFLIESTQMTSLVQNFLNQVK
jgi:homoserine O-acetyltransferase/O-succinyltransferase